MALKSRLSYVAILLLLTSLFAMPANADEFAITGQTNLATCSSLGVQCPSVSFAFNMTTGTPTTDLGTQILPVLSLTGTLDGSTVSGGGGYLWPGENPVYLLPWIDGRITLNQGDYIVLDTNSGPNQPFIYLGNTPGTWLTWNVVQVPEPGTPLLIGVVALFLFGLALFGKRTNFLPDPHD